MNGKKTGLIVGATLLLAICVPLLIVGSMGLVIAQPVKLLDPVEPDSIVAGANFLDLPKGVLEPVSIAEVAVGGLALIGGVVCAAYAAKQ